MRHWLVKTQTMANGDGSFFRFGCTPNPIIRRTLNYVIKEDGITFAHFMKYASEIEKRKTFAIISHPDAGKTTLTEKFLLFGGAIQTAGAVKSNKIKKHATSDFMEIERQRGISVAT